MYVRNIYPRRSVIRECELLCVCRECARSYSKRQEPKGSKRTTYGKATCMMPQLTGKIASLTKRYLYAQYDSISSIIRIVLIGVLDLSAYYIQLEISPNYRFSAIHEFCPCWSR